MLVLVMAYRLLQEFRQASTRLDTPPFSLSHHPFSGIAHGPAVVKSAVLASAATVEPSFPKARPQSVPNPVQASAALRMTHEIKPMLGRERGSDPIRLAPALTGLGLSVWLRRGAADTSATLEVTPGAEYNPARRSLRIPPARAADVG